MAEGGSASTAARFNAKKEVQQARQVSMAHQGPQTARQGVKKARTYLPSLTTKKTPTVAALAVPTRADRFRGRLRKRKKSYAKRAPKLAPSDRA